MKNYVLKPILLIVSIFTMLNSYGQEWELLTPISDGDIVRNCSFFDTNNGYAVIQADGVVLKTENGGSSWERPWTPGMSANLYDIEMASVDTIFTAGTSGEIFRSIDSGNSFQEMTTGTIELLYALEFVSSSIGFAAGYNGIILKTVDGGTTWEIKETGTTDRLFDIQFSSDLIGYASGYNGTMVKTDDGGETWTLLNTEFDGSLFRCSFPSDLIGYACGFNHTILKTSDGGDTWVVQNQLGTNTLNFIEFKDPLNGWAAGDWGAYYATVDGGANWVEADQTGDTFIWCGQYVGNSTAFMMGKDIMLKSIDGADNWSLLKNYVPNATYHGLHFFDDNHGYAAGSSGALGEGSNRAGIVYTDNGGDTWTTQHIGFSGGWRDIHFSDEMNGTAVGGNQFAKTSDGGENWDMSTPITDFTGKATWFINEDVGFIGGDGLFNNICKSTDGGANFVCGENLSAGDFFFVNDTLGYAIFEGGSETVFKTIDAGETWLYMLSGNNQTKHSIFFLDENIGWIGGNSGTVLRTLDGGENWESFTSGNTIVGIKFFDTQLGFSIDQQGYVYQSTDGGENWTMIISGDNNTMPLVMEGSFTENYVYAGAQSGDIYRAELGCESVQIGNVLSEDTWCNGEVNSITLDQIGPLSSLEWTLPEGFEIVEDNGTTLTASPGAEGGVVTATVTNICGITDSAETSISLASNPLAIESFSATAAICAGDTAQIILTNPENDVSFTWLYDSSWEVEENEGVLDVISANISGEYGVFTSNVCGDSDPLFGFLEVNPLPEVTLDLAQTAFCEGEELSLTGGFPEGGTYSGNGVIEDSFFTSDLEHGTSDIYYSYENENGCVSQDSVEVVITANEIIISPIQGSPFFCEGGSTLLEILTVEGANQTSWVYPGEWSIAFTSSSLNILQAGSPGDVIFTAFNDCGIQVSDTISISLSTLPEAPELISFEESWCENNTGFTSLASSGEIIISNTDFDTDTISTPEGYDFTISGDAGVYTVDFQSLNECGLSEEVLTLNYEILEAPEVSLTFDTDQFCLDEEYDATLSPAGGEFTGEGVTDISVSSLLLNAQQPYDYVYTFTAENGCTASDSTTIIFEVCVDIAEIEADLLEIYPNPTSEWLTINKYNSTLITGAIYTIMGQKVEEINLVNQSTTISVSHLSTGIYLIKLGEDVKLFEIN